MSSYNIENHEYLTDAKIDLQEMYEFFLENVSLKKLKEIPQDFNIISISRNNHRKKKEFIHKYFQCMIIELYNAITTNNVELFILVITIIASVYFNQTEIFVKIRINIERLESTNQFSKIMHENCGENFKEIIEYAINQLDTLKMYGAFLIFLDDQTNCIEGNNASDVIDEMKLYEEEIMKIHEFLHKNN